MKTSSFLIVCYCRVFVECCFVVFDVFQEGRIGIVIDPGYRFQCPNWDLCHSVDRYTLDCTVSQGNGPEAGSEGCCVIRVANRYWFLIQMSVIISNSDNFFHQLLPDNRGEAHQLMLIIVECFRWRIRPDVLLD